MMVTDNVLELKSMINQLSTTLIQRREGREERRKRWGKRVNEREVGTGGRCYMAKVNILGRYPKQIPGSLSLFSYVVGTNKKSL